LVDRNLAFKQLLSLSFSLSLISLWPALRSQLFQEVDVPFNHWMLSGSTIKQCVKESKRFKKPISYHDMDAMCIHITMLRIYMDLPNARDIRNMTSPLV
jgi:hypothetical protein